MDLISVIVPIYNSELYIRDCVGSVLRQTYTHFELILVDDGSTDNCKEICGELCEADKRIRFVSNVRGGVSVARNAGMKMANGKYLFFLDSDDAIHSSILEYLYTFLEKSGFDIALTEYFYIQTEKMQSLLQQEIIQDSHFGYTFLENAKALKCFTYGAPQQQAKMLYGIGGKLIRSSIVQELLFDERLSNGEDSKFMYQMLLQGADVAVLYQPWYYYRNHGENLTKDFSIESYESRYKCRRYMCDQEISANRRESALILEKAHLLDIETWYMESRRLHDRDLSDYIKRLAGKERRMDIFSNVYFKDKVKFLMAFHCFPLYLKVCYKNKSSLREFKTEDISKESWGVIRTNCDTNDLISVIIPVYNTSEYICECVESVLLQTYVCIELILVDDGSLDKSKDIIKMLCKKDKRILYVRQEHRGVSAARNKGIEMAKGKYIFFLDSDDIIHPQLIEMLYNLAEYIQASIVTENRYYAEDGKIRVPEEWTIEADIMWKDAYKYLDNENALEYLVSGKQEGALYTIGGKLIRREILETVRFQENLTQREDEMLLYELLNNGLEAVVLCRNWYYYRISDSGAGRAFSVLSCRSIYGVERYICEQEVEKGRIYNALEKQEAKDVLLMRWYEIAHCEHGKELIQYLRGMAKEEKKLWTFSQISWLSKISFCIMFGCYPLYWIIHRFLCRFSKYNRIRWDIKYKNMLRKKDQRKGT